MQNVPLHSVSTRSCTNVAFFGTLCAGGVALTLFAVIAPHLRNLPNLKNVPPLFSKNYFWMPLTGTGVALFTISLLGAKFTASHLTAPEGIACFLNDKGVSSSFFHHIGSFSHLPSFKAQEAKQTLRQIRKEIGEGWRENKTGIDTSNTLGREVRLAYEVLFADPNTLLVNGTPINATQQLHLFFAMLDRVPQAKGYDAVVDYVVKGSEALYNELKGNTKYSPARNLYYFTQVCYAVTRVNNSTLRDGVYGKICEESTTNDNTTSPGLPKIPAHFQNQTKRGFFPENKFVSWLGTTWIARPFFGHFCPVEQGNVPTLLQEETYTFPVAQANNDANNIDIDDDQNNNDEIEDNGIEKNEQREFTSTMIRAGCGMKDTGVTSSRFHGWTQGLIDYHYLRGETLLYVNHQNAREGGLGGLFKSEPARVRSMIAGGGTGRQARRARNQATMLVVSLPMGGPIYKGKGDITPDQLKQDVLNDMFEGENFKLESEFYLPVDAIQNRYKALNKNQELTLKDLVESSLDHVASTYFNGKNSLDSNTRKAFLLLFYVDLTRQIAAHTQSPLHWKACKNAIDRAMANNVLACITADNTITDELKQQLLDWAGISTRGRRVKEKVRVVYDAAVAQINASQEQENIPNNGEHKPQNNFPRADLQSIQSFW